MRTTRISPNRFRTLKAISAVAAVVGLSALGVGPRDLISILQSIKAAGALQADLAVH